MELSERKKDILSALIKIYINQGEPVGSKALSTVLSLDISTATLRNEMSELCEMGYLNKPHISAGRIPTNEAYKLYFNSLMEHKSITVKMRNVIDSLLEKASENPEEFIASAGEILSNIMGLPVLMVMEANDEVYIRRLEIVPIGRRAMLIVIITSNGMSKNRICRLASDLTSELILKFDEIISKNIIKKQLLDFTPAFLQTLVAQSNGFAIEISNFMTAVFDMVKELSSSSFEVKGESNLITRYQQDRDLKGIFNIFSYKRDILYLLNNIADSVELVLGESTGIDELKPSNMVVAKYNIGNNGFGTIGVIGPLRMDYDQVVPGVEYFAKTIGNIIGQTICDLED